MSFRIKLILALLLSSLAALALEGGVAWHALNHQIDVQRRQESLRHFQADVVAYLQTYGSWDRAAASMPFADFVRMRQAQGPDAPGMPPEGPGPAAPWPDGAADHLPPQFLLLGPDYRVLLPTPPYHRGDPASASDRALAQPIRLNGQLVAWAAPTDLVAPSAPDRSRLAATRHALAAGLLAATVLALILGIGLGNWLSRSLRRLADATLAGKDGTPDQRAEKQSADEMDLLAGAFTRMGEELTRSQEELRQANATIRQQAEMLRELSIRDALTGVFNRHHFDEYAARLFAEAQRYHRALTAVLGDVDHFRQINDNFSHAIGDAVLKQVAELLRVHSRGSDLVARHGDGEFVLLLAETGMPQSAHVCELLRRAVENHDWESIAPGLRVTISLGLCDNSGRDDIESMLRGADRALCEAKDAGRNCIRAAAPLGASADDPGVA